MTKKEDRDILGLMRYFLKKVFLTLFFISLFLIPVKKNVQAQEQNVRVVCLDPYFITDSVSAWTNEHYGGKAYFTISEKSGKSNWEECRDTEYSKECSFTWNHEGSSHHHVLMAKTRPNQGLVPGKKVLIIRRTSREYCDKNSTDACNTCLWTHALFTDGVPVTDHCRPCDPEKESCTTTECALDKNGNSFCKDIPNAIDEEEFRVFDYAEGEIFPNEDGSITIPHIMSYTHTGAGHTFLAVQILGSGEVGELDAENNSLKLARFEELKEEVPEIANCITVYWDPYGRIIDSIMLEPIKGAIISLSNLNNQGNKELTRVENNPLFFNPLATKADGNFNFAVPPGTYFLNPQHDSFTYPLEDADLNQVKSRLLTFDPLGIYIDTNKLYNNPTEKIIEAAGKAERRDIVMKPNDPNYQGSEPEILQKDIIKNNTTQTISGLVSHPKAIIRAVVNNNTITQTSADLRGIFKLEIANNLLSNSSDNVVLAIEKVSFFSQENDVLGESTTLHPTKQYRIDTIPANMSGFIYDKELKTIPNATVYLLIPSMENTVYATIKADKDGYIKILPKHIPPYEFILKIIDPQNIGTPLIQNVKQFKQVNAVYFAETGADFYQDRSANYKKPTQETITKIVNETQKEVKNKNLFLKPTKPISESNDQNTENKEATPKNNALGILLVFGLMLVVAVVVGFVIIKKNQQQKQVYY